LGGEVAAGGEKVGLHVDYYEGCCLGGEIRGVREWVGCGGRDLGSRHRLRGWTCEGIGRKSIVRNQRRKNGYILNFGFEEVTETGESIGT
jgi:hypothetical protein